MNVEELRSLFLNYPEVTEETPFDESTVVYKTAGKMFVLINWDENPLRANLKCEPSKAEELREQYSCVIPGYHMNKKHWNTVYFDGSVDDSVLKEWVEHSFDRVVAGFPKKKREELLSNHRKGVHSLHLLKDKNFRNQLKNSI